MDRYVSVKHKSWSDRLSESIKGVAVGILSVIAGAGILFWNEGQTIAMSRALDEGAGIVILADSSSIDPSQDGQLVHLTGKATSGEYLVDPEFGVSRLSLGLKRSVSMYQWHETSTDDEKKEVGGGTTTTTTYTYDKMWSSSSISSSSFAQSKGHENPSFPVSSWEQKSELIRVGDFHLNKDLISKLDSPTRIDVKASDLKKTSGALNRQTRIYKGGLYVGRNPSSPAVGDLQIEFSSIEPARVTVVALQQQKQLRPYLAKAGTELMLLEYGEHSPNQMFEKARAENQRMLWLLRGLGAFLIFAGFCAITKPLSVTADVVPLVGDLVEKGMLVVSFVLTLLVALPAVAAGWVAHRPLVALCLFAGTCGIGGWMIQRNRKKAATG